MTGQALPIADDLTADVAAVVDERLAQRLAAHQRRREQQQADRARRAAARTAGLKRRHAAKLARRPMESPAGPGPMEGAVNLRIDLNDPDPPRTEDTP